MRRARYLLIILVSLLLGAQGTMATARATVIFDEDEECGRVTEQAEANLVCPAGRAKGDGAAARSPLSAPRLRPAPAPPPCPDRPRPAYRMLR